MSKLEIGPKIVIEKRGTFHILSIGINKIEGFSELKNCVNDAKALVQKFKIGSKKYNDLLKRTIDEIKTGPFKNSGTAKSNIKELNGQKSKVHSYEFYDENATEKNIREAFKTIIKNAKPHHYFVFYFGGVSLPIDNFETAFALFQENKFNFENLSKNNIIKTSELASFMNQISSNSQLVISEAGLGNEFSNSLMSYLFENNPDVANNTELKRTIITSSGMGMDVSQCDKNHAPLTSYILKSGDILNAFKNIRKYELQLQKSQLDCPQRDGAYFIIRKNSDFKGLLNFKNGKLNSRGTLTKSNIKKKKKDSVISKTYALIIGTDKYSPNQNSWADLQNPINDAEAVANLLHNKFKVEVLKVYNKTKNDIFKELITLKNKINKKDRLIFFAAGHGYYNENLSDGFLVLNNSKSLNEDYILDSYLSMACLNRFLDGMECKQLFTIFDVCFGASFDLNSKEVKLSNYSKIKSDISIDEFIKRKDEYTSRIFLASGKAEVPDYWNNSLNHSPFANKLIDYLKNEKKFLSPGKIYEALEANITEPVIKSYGSHEERGDFILKVKNTIR